MPLLIRILVLSCSHARVQVHRGRYRFRTQEYVPRHPLLHSTRNNLPCARQLPITLPILCAANSTPPSPPLPTSFHENLEREHPAPPHPVSTPRPPPPTIPVSAASQNIELNPHSDIYVEFSTTSNLHRHIVLARVDGCRALLAI